MPSRKTSTLSLRPRRSPSRDLSGKSMLNPIEKWKHHNQGVA
jgi:hypothetical protein